MLLKRIIGGTSCSGRQVWFLFFLCWRKLRYTIPLYEFRLNTIGVHCVPVQYNKLYFYSSVCIYIYIYIYNLYITLKTDINFNPSLECDSYSASASSSVLLRFKDSSCQACPFHYLTIMWEEEKRLITVPSTNVSAAAALIIIPLKKTPFDVLSCKPEARQEK